MMLKENEMNKMQKQLIFFLLICLPVTWILEGIAYGVAPVSEANPGAVTILNLACCIPAITAILVSVMTKENILNLRFFPKFQGNVKVYLFAVLSGFLLTCFVNPITELFFPKVQKLHPDVTMPMIVFTVLLAVAMTCLQCIVLLGEEIGWMGFLFPRLEILCGTNAALVLTGIVRGSWHIVMLAQGEKVGMNFILLCMSNIIGGCLLVLLTKKSGSVVPAALVHGLSNGISGLLAGFYMIDEALYQANEMGIQVVTMIPNVVIGVLCWLVLMKRYKVDRMK